MGRAERRAIARARQGKRAGGGQRVRLPDGSNNVAAAPPPVLPDRLAHALAPPTRREPEGPQAPQGSPPVADGLDDALEELRRAAAARQRADARIAAAVAVARSAGASWAKCGAILGVTGEAIRQRYTAKRPPPAG